jgi:hypothetical protein
MDCTGVCTWEVNYPLDVSFPYKVSTTTYELLERYVSLLVARLPDKLARRNMMLKTQGSHRVSLVYVITSSASIL